MSQLYLQRFEYRGAISKAEFDQAWGAALETFARSNNWGGAETGVRHVKTYGTAWGGYALIEVGDPAAFCQVSDASCLELRPYGADHVRAGV
jgi:hypothetical protein